MARSKDKVRAEIQKVLSVLTKEEQTLLSRVIKIEDEQIHLERPRVTEDIVRQVRLVVS